MNLKTWLPLGLAVVLGLVAAMFARDMISKNKGSGNDTGALVSVVVAKDQIGAGQALTADNCGLGKVASDSVPDGAFKTMADIKDRVAAVQMGKGLPITETLLATNGVGTGLQILIPRGMRAITIEVNEFSGVGGMVVPGCHIDLIATVPAIANGEMIARTVVQNVEIASVGQRMVKQPDKKGDEPQTFRSVTFFATPAECEAIELAANSGRPRLSLRNGNDSEIAMTPGVTSSNLRGPSARKTEQAYFSVKVIRGTTESEVRMDNGWTPAVDAKVDQHQVSNTDNHPVSNNDTSPVSGNH